MATEVFVDTQTWIALIQPRDPYRDIVLRSWPAAPGAALVTSEFVLAQFLGFVCERGPTSRREAATAVRRTAGAAGMLVIPASHTLFDDALRLYEARPDKGYSLVDCTSMVIMRERGIEGVLSADRHFEQEGFHALFRA